MTVAINAASGGDSRAAGNGSGKSPLPGIAPQYPDIVVELESANDRAERPLSPAESYAAAMYLLSRSQVHRAAPVGLVDPMLREALRLGQIKIYRHRGAPVAVAFWAYLNEEIERRLLSGGPGLKPEELRAGDRLWIMDIVTPFGNLADVRKDLAATLFDSAEYRELPRRGRPDTAGPLAVSPVAPAITYRPAQQEDIATLAPRLRRQDQMELLAATGRDAAAALSESFNNSKRCWSALLDGQVVAMFGVSHMHNRPRDGRVWMLGSDEVFRQGRALLRDGPVWLRELMKGHGAIGNYVDARNDAYIRWLKRLGFRFVRLHEQYGLQKQPFWEFFMTPADLVAAVRQPAKAAHRRAAKQRAK